MGQDRKSAEEQGVGKQGDLGLFRLTGGLIHQQQTMLLQWPTGQERSRPAHGP